MFDIILEKLWKKHKQDSERILLHHILVNQHFIIQKLNAMAKQSEILEDAVSKLETAVKNIPGANANALTDAEAQGFADRVVAATASIPQNPPADPVP